MKEIVIIGTSGFAKEILFLLKEDNKHRNQWVIKGFIGKEEGEVLGYPILGNDEWLIHYGKEINAVCGVGSPVLRKKIVDKFSQYPSIKFPAIIADSARIGESSRFDRGVIVCAGAIVTEEVSIGEFGIVNINSTIGHETIIEPFVTISHGVNISGNNKIGFCTDIGVGAITIQNIRIGNNVTIGAGTVVIRDVESGNTVVGNPARIIK